MLSLCIACHTVEKNDKASELRCTMPPGLGCIGPRRGSLVSIGGLNSFPLTLSFSAHRDNFTPIPPFIVPFLKCSYSCLGLCVELSAPAAGSEHRIE